MDAASLANTMVQSQAALTTQKLSTAVQKSNLEAQQAVTDILTQAAATSTTPSANSAITGRGQMLDISV